MSDSSRTAFYTSFVASGLYRVKSPLFSLEEVQCKNNYLPRRHAPYAINTRGLVDGNRYTGIHIPTLRFLINIKYSYLKATSTFKFFGVTVDSGEMALSFPVRKSSKCRIST